MTEHFQIFAGAVDDLEHARGAEQRHQHGADAGDQGIDQGDGFGGGQLNQTQFRMIGLGANELGIERDCRMVERALRVGLGGVATGDPGWRWRRVGY